LDTTILWILIFSGVKISTNCDILIYFQARSNEAVKSTKPSKFSSVKITKINIFYPTKIAD